MLAAVSLIPLAWLIGESTEHAAEHTGPGIGGFLNASFGNAPELIIALFAVSDNLPQVVRGSLSGSVISNLLLVYGVTQIAGPDDEPIDRRSLLTQVGLVAAAVRRASSRPSRSATRATPSVTSPSSPRSRSRSCSCSSTSRSSAATCAATARSERDEAAEGAWSLPVALAVLAAATVARRPSSARSSSTRSARSRRRSA